MCNKNGLIISFSGHVVYDKGSKTIPIVVYILISVYKVPFAYCICFLQLAYIFTHMHIRYCDERFNIERFDLSTSNVFQISRA